MGSLKKIKLGSLTAYEFYKETGVIDEDTFYVVTNEDTKVQYMYKGTTKLMGNFTIADTNDTGLTIEEGVIYFIKNFNNTGKSFVGINQGGTWIPFACDEASRIDVIEQSVSSLTTTVNDINAKYLDKDLVNLSAEGEQKILDLVDDLKKAILQIDIVAASGLADLDKRLKTIENLIV